MVRGGAGGVLTGERVSAVERRLPPPKPRCPRWRRPLPLNVYPLGSTFDLEKKLDDAVTENKYYHRYSCLRSKRKQENTRLVAELARTRAMPFQELADFVWHAARRFESKVDVEVDAACEAAG